MSPGWIPNERPTPITIRAALINSHTPLAKICKGVVVTQTANGNIAVVAGNWDHYPEWLDWDDLTRIKINPVLPWLDKTTVEIDLPKDYNLCLRLGLLDTLDYLVGEPVNAEMVE